MIKRISVFLPCLLVLGVLAFAVNATGKLDSRLYDSADVLTANEEIQVLKHLDSVSQQYNVDIVVATVPALAGVSANRYTENFYDNNDIGTGSRHDGVLLLLAMQERDYRILSNGMPGDAIDNDAIDAIGDKIVSDLSAGEYADAFIAFAGQCAYYIDGYLNGFPFPVWDNLTVCLIIGFAVAAIAVIVMCAQLKSVRKQHGAANYTRPGSMQLTHSCDIFLYRNVSKVKIQTSSSSGGGSGGSRHIGGGKF